MTNWYSQDQTATCVFAAVCVAVGLLGLLLGTGTRRKTRDRLEVGLFLLLASLGLGSWLLGAPALIWLPILGVVGTSLLLVSLRHFSLVHLGYLIQGTLARPIALWIGLFLVGIGTLVAQRLDLESQLVPDFVVESPDGPSADQLLQPVETQWAVTDTGRAVPLFTIPASTAAEIAFDDNPSMRRQLSLAMIRTGEVDLSYNCHGFVFAAGRYWVRGAGVELILQDNGYQPTTAPRPGDVVVYRDEQGVLVHTGLVRTILDADGVLIESKMGSCGRFIHGADRHPYPNTTATYYHTRRGSHVLNGLEGLRHPGQLLTSETMNDER